MISLPGGYTAIQSRIYFQIRAPDFAAEEESLFENYDIRMMTNHAKMALSGYWTAKASGLAARFMNRMTASASLGNWNRVENAHGPLESNNAYGSAALYAPDQWFQQEIENLEHAVELQL